MNESRNAKERKEVHKAYTKALHFYESFQLLLQKDEWFLSQNCIIV